jgi:hypothetical protein
MIGWIVGRPRPLHRARHWAISYLLELTPDRANPLKMVLAALLVLDFVARGHQAERQRPKSLRAKRSPSPETTPDAPTGGED